MVVGKLYKIFLKDGAISCDVGILLDYPGTGKFENDISFLVNGEIRKYSKFWYEFREYDGNK